MKYKSFVLFLLAMFFCVPAWATKTAPVQVAGCVANAAAACTWANFSGKSASVGDLLYYFAFRTALTAPTAPGSTTNVDTNSASTSSFRSGCAVLTSTTPAATTATNATSIFVAIIHGTAARATADCLSAGIGFRTTTGASGTTSTYTYTGGTLTNAGGSSLVLGAVGSSAAPCTPASLTNIAANSSTNIFDNDTNGGVATFTTTTCTGTAGNWKTDTVEFLATSTVVHAASSHGTAVSASPATITFTPATGQAMFVSGFNFYGAGATGTYSTPTDTGSNTWSVAIAKVNATTQQEDATTFCAIANGSSAITVTLAYSGTVQTTSLEAFDDNFTNGSCTPDKTGSATGTTGVPTGSITPVTDDVALFGATYASITGAGAGFTIGSNDGNGDGTEFAEWSHNGGSAVTILFAGSSGNFLQLMAAIQPPAPAGVATPQRLTLLGVGP